MQPLVPEEGKVPEEVVQKVREVEDVLDVHGCSGELQVKVVELHEEEQLARYVHEQVPPWECSQKVAMKCIEVRW